MTQSPSDEQAQLLSSLPVSESRQQPNDMETPTASVSALTYRPPYAESASGRSTDGSRYTPPSTRHTVNLNAVAGKRGHSDASLPQDGPGRKRRKYREAKAGATRIRVYEDHNPSSIIIESSRTALSRDEATQRVESRAAITASDRSLTVVAEPADEEASAIPESLDDGALFYIIGKQKDSILDEPNPEDGWNVWDVQSISDLSFTDVLDEVGVSFPSSMISCTLCFRQSISGKMRPLNWYVGGANGNERFEGFKRRWTAIRSAGQLVSEEVFIYPKFEDEAQD
jgi:hypothetical protein